ncbi:MAG TPA: redox-regulated ATPase YchF [Thermoplasmata archaeon]|nr:redox-regulated ATPase YchF [Thermoplasmata archaeon]
MELGVVGKPNVGKSTFFAAATLAPAQIANYPFTTIEPNRGVAFIRKRCPHLDLGKACKPNNAPCQDGTRLIPVELLDVAGLVPKAHEGRGLGNKFLDDLRQASALVHVIDATGGTDFEGNPVPSGSHDPLDDVRFLEEELAYWIAGILSRNWEKDARRADLEAVPPEKVVHGRLTGLGLTEAQVHLALRETPLDPKMARWSSDDLLRLARTLQRRGKPMILAANKADLTPPEALERLGKTEGYHVVPTSSAYELALRRAAAAGFIAYEPGARSFRILDPSKLSPAQQKGLETIEAFLRERGSTGVQACLEEAVFRLLDLIVVYPVEDEHHWTDKSGNVLPDAFLVPRGSTAVDVAFKVHTDLGNHFIRAINARTKMVVGRDHPVQDGDVMKIVAKV